MLSPVQINEEAEKVVTQFNHSLLHVRLELTSVVDLSGVKHTHVSHWNLHVPVVPKKQTNKNNPQKSQSVTLRRQLQMYSSMFSKPGAFQTLAKRVYV